MANTIEITNEDEFIREVVPIEDLDLSDDGARELWKIWTERYENGADEDVLVALPSWFAQNEFGNNRPYFFAKIEHDDPNSGAILFSDARQIDINVIENGIWDRVTMTDALSVLDVTDDNEYIDESGKVWTPRSLMHIFERVEQTDVKDFGGGIAGSAADAYDS